LDDGSLRKSYRFEHGTSDLLPGDPAKTALNRSEKTWSDWSTTTPLASEIGISNPPARYLQYRVQSNRDLKSPSAMAELRRVQFYYQNQNAAPVIARIRVHTDGFGVSKMTQPPMDAPVNLDQLLSGGGRATTPAPILRPPLKMTRSPGLCMVV
jgi:hypothetical protein